MSEQKLLTYDPSASVMPTMSAVATTAVQARMRQKDIGAKTTATECLAWYRLDGIDVWCHAVRKDANSRVWFGLCVRNNRHVMDFKIYGKRRRANCYTTFLCNAMTSFAYRMAKRQTKEGGENE